MLRRRWLYPQFAKPVPRPGGEAETIYTAAWHPQQNQPERNFAARKIATGALIAAMPFVFFQPVISAAAPDLPHPQTQQPLFRPPSRIHAAPSFFFDPRPLFFTGQPDVQTQQPLPRAKDRRHSYPSFFFQPFIAAPAFTEHVEGAVSQPQFRRVNTAYRQPYFFAPVSPPGQEAETIYLPGWFQPTQQPVRNQALRGLQRTWLAAAAPTTFQQGPPIAAEVFYIFKPITRFIAGTPDGSEYLEVFIHTSNALYACQARLYNITDATVVSGSIISTTSLTTVRVRSAAITLNTTDKEYRVEYGGTSGVGAIYTCYAGDVIWTPPV